MKKYQLPFLLSLFIFFNKTIDAVFTLKTTDRKQVIVNLDGQAEAGKKLQDRIIDVPLCEWRVKEYLLPLLEGRARSKDFSSMINNILAWDLAALYECGAMLFNERVKLTARNVLFKRMIDEMKLSFPQVQMTPRDYLLKIGLPQELCGEVESQFPEVGPFLIQHHKACAEERRDDHYYNACESIDY